MSGVKANAPMADEVRLQNNLEAQKSHLQGASQDTGDITQNAKAAQQPSGARAAGGPGGAPASAQELAGRAETAKRIGELKGDAERAHQGKAEAERAGDEQSSQQASRQLAEVGRNADVVIAKLEDRRAQAEAPVNGRGSMVSSEPYWAGTQLKRAHAVGRLAEAGSEPELRRARADYAQASIGALESAFARSGAAPHAGPGERLTAAQPPEPNRPMDLRGATQTLLEHYDKAAEGRSLLDRLLGRGGGISKSDLERLTTAPDPSTPRDLQDAARFLLDSNVSRHFLDLGAGKGRVDGNISHEDLRGALDTIDSGAYYDELLDTAAGQGGWRFWSDARDGHVSRQDVEAALADPGVPKQLKDMSSLLRDSRFRALPAEEQTAVLSQAANYPDSRSIGNLERVLHNDWFQDQSLEDKQRTLKLIAYASQYDPVDPGDTGDRTILENTLDRLLDPGSDYNLKWMDISPAIGQAENPGAHDVTLNSQLLTADNNPVDPRKMTTVVLDGGNSAELPFGGRTAVRGLAHEISHMINDDVKSADELMYTYNYINAEYRAWHIGFRAEHGHPPTNKEALERWGFYLNDSGGYAPFVFGITKPEGDFNGALEKPGEAAKFFQTLSHLTGLEVNVDSHKPDNSFVRLTQTIKALEAVLNSDPNTWNTDPNAPAAALLPGDPDN